MVVVQRTENDRRVGGDRPANAIDGIKTLHEIGFDTLKLNGCKELGLFVKLLAIRLSLVLISTIAPAC